MSPTSVTFFRYLPVSDFDRKWGLHVTTVGNSWCAPGQPYPPAQHPHTHHFHWERGRIVEDFQVVYITRGNGILETAKAGRRVIQAGDLFLVFPCEWHRYRPNPAVGWDEHWLGVSGEYPERWIGGGLFNLRHPVFHVGFDTTWNALFVKAIELVKVEPPGFQQILGAVALEMLGRLHACRRTRTAEGQTLGSLVQEARLYLTERLEQDIDLLALAASLGVSYATLRQEFKLHTGFSPHQYQLELRMGRAKKLLATSLLPIKSIADELGFKSPYYFSRLFKKKIGLCPESWRHQVQGGGYARPTSNNARS